MKLLRLAFCVLFLFFLYSPKANAAENFTTDYTVRYNVSETGNTQVTFDIALQNTTSQYYASSYDIQIGFDTVKNVTAKDTGGPITPKIVQGEDGQNVSITFNEKVVGIGKTLEFSLTFDTPDVAKKFGNVWEINIPGLTNQNDYDSFAVLVTYPESFGTPAYIKPPFPAAQINSTTLQFSKEELESSGVAIAFGEKQIVDFNLTYNLKNQHLFPIKTEIAIPPSTNYQDVFINSMDPPPLQVKIDEDGNWLAEYNLLPSETKKIIVTGNAQLFLNPKVSEQTPEQLQKYLIEKPYWPISDSEIKELAKTLKTPRQIYDYVVETLEYDFSRVTDNKPRVGGKNVLLAPTSAVCLEFTDLFVTLARAAGIPAREVDGFAYTENSRQRPLSLVQDVLHAWPQYYDYDLKTWVMVDPTWGNTTKGIDYFNTLDFDHFAFVIKGLESDYPVPAGGYKLPGQENNKDVKVSFINSLPTYPQITEFNVNLPTNALSALPIKGSLVAKNTGHTVTDPQVVTITSEFLTPRSQKVTVPKIPPFGSVIIPFTFDKTPFLTNRDELITITVGGKTYSNSVHISPFHFSKQTIVIGGVTLVFCIIIISIIAWSARRLPIFRREQ